MDDTGLPGSRSDARFGTYVGGAGPRRGASLRPSRSACGGRRGRDGEGHGWSPGRSGPGGCPRDVVRRPVEADPSAVKCRRPDVQRRCAAVRDPPLGGSRKSSFGRVSRVKVGAKTLTVMGVIVQVTAIIRRPSRRPASRSRGSATASRARGSPSATDTRTSGGNRGTPYPRRSPTCASRSATNMTPCRPGYSQSAGYSPA